MFYRLYGEVFRGLPMPAPQAAVPQAIAGVRRAVASANPSSSEKVVQ